jgi:glyoxylase-like metal-dependent hydrolase (beta-lactamase superfamily II)
VSETGTISMMSTNDLVPLLDVPDRPYLLDVREPDEVADWAIDGVINIPLGGLAARLNEVPTDRDVVVICAKGMRAQAGAEILAAAGRSSTVLDGGMGAWASTYDVVEQTIAGATVLQVRRRGKGCLSYVIGAGDRAIVIDPSLNVALYQSLAAERGWRIAYVLDTHLHADHLSGARELVERTGGELLLSDADPFDFPFTPLRDGQHLDLTAEVGLTVSAVSVPGHTEGSTMYQLGQEAIFTGDTLFLESVGRPDLADHAESFARNLFRSLHERILPLSSEALVFPAHYGTVVPVRAGELVTRTLGELRATLPALFLDETAFVAWALENVKDRPPNYQMIVRVNAGIEPVTSDAAEMELGPNRCAVAS